MDVKYKGIFNTYGFVPILL